MKILLLTTFALNLAMAILMPLPYAVFNALVSVALAVVIVTENAR